MNEAEHTGGGLYCNSGDYSVANCTFYGNESPEGTAIGVAGGAPVEAMNTILSFGIGGDAVCGCSDVTMSCCDVHGNASGPGIVGIQIGQDGNIAEDPLFCDPEIYNFELEFHSPCASFTGPNPECDLIGAWERGCAPPPDLEPGQELPGLHHGDAAWADFDGDGDLDLVYCGATEDDTLTITVENVGDSLQVKSETDIVGVAGPGNGCLSWADYDLDGDLDLAVVGVSKQGEVSRIYVNDPVGTLREDDGTCLHGMTSGAAAWGDYDNDGDLDLAKTGNESPGNARTRIYENDEGSFTEVADLLDVMRSSCAWGDCNNDGKLDLIAGGLMHSGSLRTEIFSNLDGTLTGPCFWDSLASNGSLTWADADEDGDLDLFMMGDDLGGGIFARLYRNQATVPNTPPDPPDLLEAFPAVDSLGNWTYRVTWSGAGDFETPASGLYYCLRVGTTPEGGEIVPGTYVTPLMGNVLQMSDITLQTPGAAYYWSVRAIRRGCVSSMPGGDSCARW